MAEAIVSAKRIDPSPNGRKPFFNGAKRGSMTIEEVQRFFRNFGFEPHHEYKPIAIKHYELVVKTARRWHGREFAEMVMDCFIPTGRSMAPGYEDSYSHYYFASEVWDELECGFFRTTD